MTSSELFGQLLDTRSWVALDVDLEGRVLAGHDDLGSMQLVEIAPDGTTTALTDLSSKCRGRYVRGHRQVVVEHDQGGDENFQLSLLDLTELPSSPVGLDGLTPLVADAGHLNILLDVTESSVIFCTNRRNDVDMDVVVRDLASDEERVVYDAGGYVGSTEVSHDEKSVAVTMISLQPSSTTVVLADGTGVVTLTDPDERGAHHVAGWTADDSALVLASEHDREFHAVLRLDRDGGWTTLVEAHDHDVTARLSPDGRLMLVAHHVDGLDRLAVHRADGGHVADVDLEPVVPVSVVWAPDSSAFAVTAMTPTDPGSIVRVDPTTGATTVLVDGRDGVPDGVRAELVTPSVHRVPTPDGEQVPCFRYASPRATGASVVHIHGGPEAEATRLFSPVIQALALAGFDVLVPNVRGSAGYGRRWVSLDDVRLRLDSVADLAAIHAWLPTVGLDPGRAALWGGSYGGYMVLCGVSMQPDLWAAGVDIVGMSSLVTFLENTSEYRRAVREREYGTLADDRDFLVAASPITYLDDIATPLFVIHGANDPRVPLSEAEQIKAALDGRGVPCEQRVYADEGHGLAKRANRLDAYPAALEFLEEHLRA
ncbi:MAG TPA: alpha/beta fold hydrolase [Nocardioides sp.]|uniref:S9 family peptidase n=1 Tax=Nocardioides sp. TaxID=35761 RepID=UPI002E30CA4A|nr:alpha/beta fold hydrolase [Nocardioides sp.]HEX3932129.1 alpha/beta fold hydrolase [Nocardioides sp.]